MKIETLFLSFLLFYGSTFAQSTFPYDRQWGTYVGGAGTILSDSYFNETSFFKDSQNNYYVSGKTDVVPAYSSVYYNQFVTGGGGAFIAGNSSNFYSGKFSNDAQMLKGEYSGISGSFTKMLGVDNVDNHYILKVQPGSIPNLSTPGTWLSQSTGVPGSTTYTLSKYSSSQNLLWTTYLPTNSGEQIALRFDESQNVYITGYTYQSIDGISTPGVYQENFIPYVSGGQNFGNSFIVKLNSNGSKLWGSYSVVSVFDFEVYDGNIYTFGEYRTGMPAGLTTAGTFQHDVPGTQVLSKFNAATGQRVWGSFYGSPILSSYVGLGICDIEVNETGLYVSGQSEDGANPGYHSTSGAFKPQLTGSGDLFISKFNLNGIRIWSTYFGSSGYDIPLANGNLSVLGNKIVITGNQYGTADNLSTPGAFLTSPPNSPAGINMFFTEFDENGTRKWTSYFGGPGGNTFEEQLSPKLLSDGSLILWGLTGSPTGIGTEGAAFQYMLSPAPPNPFGYIAKFVLKSPLSTIESAKHSEIQLFDNPNNGNFSVVGNILEKQKSLITIFDMTGKQIYSSSINKKKVTQFILADKLIHGVYLLKITTENGDEMKTFKMIIR